MPSACVPFKLQLHHLPTPLSNGQAPDTHVPGHMHSPPGSCVRARASSSPYPRLASHSSNIQGSQTASPHQRYFLLLPEAPLPFFWHSAAHDRRWSQLGFDIGALVAAGGIFVQSPHMTTGSPALATMSRSVLPVSPDRYEHSRNAL